MSCANNSGHQQQARHSDEEATTGPANKKLKTANSTDSSSAAHSHSSNSVRQRMHLHLALIATRLNVNAKSHAAGDSRAADTALPSLLAFDFFRVLQFAAYTTRHFFSRERAVRLCVLILVSYLFALRCVCVCIARVQLLLLCALSADRALNVQFANDS